MPDDLRVPGLPDFPTGMGRTLRWAWDGSRWRLTDDRGERATLLARADGSLVGSIDAVPVAVRPVGRRGRVHLVRADGRDVAGFTPDWAGLGPIETADGLRYQWTRSAWSGSGALVRDAAGAGVVRVQARDGEGLVERYGTLPDGHAAALVVLSWGIAISERAGPGRVLRFGPRAVPPPTEEWM